MSDQWIKEYVQLAFRIDKVCQEKVNHWFFDSFYGPPEWRTAIDQEPIKPLTELLEMATTLGDTLSKQTFAERRVTFLQKQVQAMETICRILNNENIPFEESVYRCLDIHPQWISNEYFEQGLALFDEALPGKESLQERFGAWANKNIIQLKDPELVMSLMKRMLKEAKQRTQALIPLPTEENVDLKIIADEAYGAANWYLGNYRSRMELNISRPLYLPGLLYQMCHEGYPGHHTEFSLKEKHVYHKLGYIEQSIFMISPQLVIAEGIASLATEMIFSPSEQAQWMLEHMYIPLNIEVGDVDLAKVYEASTIIALDDISGNVVLMVKEGRSDDEIINYLSKYTLYPKPMLQGWLGHMKLTIPQIYAFSYSGGKRWVKRFLDRENKDNAIQQLFTEQLYPSLLTN